MFCTPRPLISVVTKSVYYTSPFILQNVAYFKNHKIRSRYQDFVSYKVYTMNIFRISCNFIKRFAVQNRCITNSRIPEYIPQFILITQRWYWCIEIYAASSCIIIHYCLTKRIWGSCCWKKEAWATRRRRASVLRKYILMAEAWWLRYCSSDYGFQTSGKLCKRWVSDLKPVLNTYAYTTERYSSLKNFLNKSTTQYKKTI